VTDRFHDLTVEFYCYGNYVVNGNCTLLDYCIPFDFITTLIGGTKTPLNYKELHVVPKLLYVL